MTSSRADQLSDFLEQMHVPLFEHQRRLLEIALGDESGDHTYLLNMGGRSGGRSMVDRLAQRFCHQMGIHMHFHGRDYRRCIGREDAKTCPDYTPFDLEAVS